MTITDIVSIVASTIPLFVCIFVAYNTSIKCEKEIIELKLKNGKLSEAIYSLEKDIAVLNRICEERHGKNKLIINE